MGRYPRDLCICHAHRVYLRVEAQEMMGRDGAEDVSKLRDPAFQETY